MLVCFVSSASLLLRLFQLSRDKHAEDAHLTPPPRNAPNSGGGVPQNVGRQVREKLSDPPGPTLWRPSKVIRSDAICDRRTQRLLWSFHAFHWLIRSLDHHHKVSQTKHHQYPAFWNSPNRVYKTIEMISPAQPPPSISPGPCLGFM